LQTGEQHFFAPYTSQTVKSKTDEIIFPHHSRPRAMEDADLFSLRFPESQRKVTPG
jgi:hypothetical protein